MRKSTKIDVVLAAAALLVAGFAFTSLAGWVKEAEGVYYYEDADGNRVYNEWKKDTDANGKVNYYYLGDDGYMVTEQLVDDAEGNTFWVGADGAKVINQWVKVPVAADDVEANFDEEYRWYRFDAKGKALKDGKKAVEGVDYIFDANGKMSFGYVRADGTMCDSQKTPFAADCVYFCGTNEDGSVRKNYWEKVESVTTHDAFDEDATYAWVYFDKKGVKACATRENAEYGFLYEGRRYYFNDLGEMLTGWQDIGTPTAVNAYLGGEDEGWVQKKVWVRVKNAAGDKKWYFTDAQGCKVGAGTVLTINQKQYAFNADAEMLAGVVEINDLADGVIVPGTSKVVKAWTFDKTTLKEWIDARGNFFFFSNDEEKDGSLKKSTTFELELLDDTYKFVTDKHGKLLNGEVSKKFYKNGYLLKADADFGKQVINVNKSGDAASWKVIDVNGTVTQTKKKAMDLDKNWYAVQEDGTIYKVPEWTTKASAVADAVCKGDKSIKIDSKTTKKIKYGDVDPEMGYGVITLE